MIFSYLCCAFFSIPFGTEARAQVHLLLHLLALLSFHPFCRHVINECRKFMFWCTSFYITRNMVIPVLYF